MKQFFLKERNMLLAILLNAIIIFLLYFPQIEKGYPHIYKYLEYLDYLFVIIFLIEAIVKLMALKPKNYFADKWNKFDFLIVLVSLPSLLTLVYPIIPHTSVLKILRLLRLVRLIRAMQFIPHMESILAGLGRALKASVFVMIALFFLNFMLALFTCHFYSHIAPEFFGDPLISSYTIFQFFTVEGWNEIPATIAERTDNNFIAGLSRFYFVLVVLAGGIFGMSLANAIFVDEMTIDNNRELEDKIDDLNSKVEELKTLLQNRG